MSFSRVPPHLRDLQRLQAGRDCCQCTYSGFGHRTVQDRSWLSVPIPQIRCRSSFHSTPHMFSAIDAPRILLL